MTGTVSDEGLKIDDVVQAYRWLLGREPESFDVIRSHIENVPSREELRLNFILSREFQSVHKATISDAIIEAPPERYLGSDEERLVFLHIPKTGGTTLHSLLAREFEPDEVNNERHNKLSRVLGCELASARFFSGHFDSQSLKIIPGKHRIVSMLREPRSRLVSVYQYLRAHRQARIRTEGLEMVALARRYDFASFLKAALEVNPAAVDNTYLRTFAAQLPQRRWEQRAEAGAIRDLQHLGAPVPELLQKALDFVEEAAAVGILEQFESSLRKIFSAIGKASPTSFKLHQRLTDLIEEHPDFEPITDFQTSTEAEKLVDHLTQYDAVIYQRALALLTEQQCAA